MNDLQILYFLTLGKNLNFTKTAEELSVTQPAVSRQISSLEKELGVSLFERGKKTTKLSDAGHLYYELFSEFQLKFQLINDRAQSLNRQKKGQIRLGCLEGWDISGFFPDILEKFRQDYPNVGITLDCFSGKDLIHALKTDAIDAAMSMDLTFKDIPKIHLEQLTQIPQIILFFSKHPLVSKQDLQPADFANEVFFAIDSEEASYDTSLVRECMRPFGFEPKIQIVRNIESMNACVHNGMGVAISDWWSTAKGMNDFKYLKTGSTRPIVMAWKEKNDTPEIEVLAEEFKYILGIDN